MNCKQGDLAIIVRSWAGNEGKIVRCVKFIPLVVWINPDGSADREPGWIADVTTINCAGMPGNKFMDSQLRPIRDQDGEDEMLRIAGKPTEKREWFKPNLTPTVKVVVR